MGVAKVVGVDKVFARDLYYLMSEQASKGRKAS